jgi:TPR repeat protein
MYELGRGVEQDSAQVLDWYRKAAEQGHAGAQFNLGLIYARGLGVKQDDAQAVYWYRKAAEQGHAGAQLNLGLMYEFGLAVEKDYAQSFDWYSKAADQGHAEAQCYLGGMYQSGEGVKEDQVQAMFWYCKAAAQGDAEAQLIMASAFHKGLGVKKDILQATYWMLRSAHDGKRSRPFRAIREFIQNFYSDVIQCIPAALTRFPEFKNIKAINFSRIELSEQDFLSIGQMIRANAHLEILNLELQELDDAQALILSVALAFNTTLTEIIFDDEYGFDTTIFDQIKASLAQNVIIAKLRERLKGHLITGPDGLPIRVPYITRSDELPLEVLEIIVDNMIVKASKVGKDNKVIIAGIDEFLLSVSRETLKYDFSVMNKHHKAT